MRADAVLLYAWCRHCDDVIDGQELGFADGAQPCLHAPSDRLARLRAETEAALRGVATDSVFAAFGEVMQRHAVPARYPLEHLDGYAMDVADRRYETIEDTLDYCYGVAGTVGIMMAHVMGVRDEADASAGLRPRPRVPADQHRAAISSDDARPGGSICRPSGSSKPAYHRGPSPRPRTGSLWRASPAA